MEAISPKILVPTDFSSPSDNAFTYALSLAEQIGAEIVVVHAYHYSDPEALLAPVEMLEDLHSSRREDAFMRFQAYRKQAEVQHFSRLRMNPVVKKGYAAQIILEACEREDPFLVVMGCRGQSSAQRMLGSVTLKVVREAKCPVLAVPVRVPYKPITNIALATDFRENEDQISQQLRDMLDTLDAQLCGVHVRKPKETPPKVVSGKYPGGNTLQGTPIFWIEGPDTASSLLHFVRKQHIDVLAMVSYQHSFLEDLVQPGVTFRLTQQMEVPLLVFHE